MESKAQLRNNYLDWLRVLGILFVFIYHSTRFYNVEEWIVKNETWYPAVEVWNGIAASWMMPLMFLISGASLYYATRKGGFDKFLKDKTLRLLVPLLVCDFTHASLQAYLQSRSHGWFLGSYFQFLPSYYRLDAIAWEGMHLWYLLYLFVFSLLLYPLMRWLQSRGRGVLSRVNSWLSRGVWLYTLMLPMLLLALVFDPDGPLMETYGGYPLFVYLWIVLLGFFLVSDSAMQERVRQLRWVSLATGLLLVAAFSLLYNLTPDRENVSPALVLAIAMRAFGGWIIVLAFYGLAMQYLNARPARLDYANEAVLPFYILHQTVLLSVGFFVLRWGLPDPLEWAVVVAISFPLIMLIYEYLVRRWNVMRFLFGMKPLPPRRVPGAVEPRIGGAARTG